MPLGTVSGQVHEEDPRGGPGCRRVWERKERGVHWDCGQFLLKLNSINALAQVLLMDLLKSTELTCANIL